MEKSFINGVPLIRAEAVVVGSGAASLNAADELAIRGIDTVIVTEGLKMGTSRNAGSDKQTYYKLQLTGSESDSVHAMAESLYSGGAMDGGLALTEAANSVAAFFKLVSLGVPFPQNEYGEFVGYKTDHDDSRRATSCGPLTSRCMTECLEKSVVKRNVPIFDGARVIGILKNDDGNTAGVCVISRDFITSDNLAGLVCFNAPAVVYGVGGPSAIYAASVYPESQTCAHGCAFEAGATGINLTESQYGIASLSFRWNLSGSYQQALPRYYSVDKNYVTYDFLSDAIPDAVDRLESIFLKGYQWPFDPTRVKNGSSRIDLAIYAQRTAGRRVYMDFTRNDPSLDEVGYPPNALEYLKKSEAIAETPIKRLMALNNRAYDLYRDHGIDLAFEPLEIGVCAQHNNGGLECDINYMSPSLPGFYPVGESAGVFGVRRPGGSALNSTQVSSMRAARHIAEARRPITNINQASLKSVSEKLSMLTVNDGMSREEILAERKQYGMRMDKAGAFIRSEQEVLKALNETESILKIFIGTHSAPDHECLRELCINYDILITQFVYLSAIYEYIRHGGVSRGSYLIKDRDINSNVDDIMVCRMSYKDGMVSSEWREAAPIPDSEQWFERVYNSQSEKT